MLGLPGAGTREQPPGGGAGGVWDVTSSSKGSEAAVGRGHSAEGGRLLAALTCFSLETKGSITRIL